jgi:hypothetical protein
VLRHAQSLPHRFILSKLFFLLCLHLLLILLFFDRLLLCLQPSITKVTNCSPSLIHKSQSRHNPKLIQNRIYQIPCEY